MEFVKWTKNVYSSGCKKKRSGAVGSGAVDKLVGISVGG